MTPQERQLLEDFLNKLASVQGVEKDAEADALISQQATRQPDALYLTIQRSLILDNAMQAAQERIQVLEQKVKDLESAAKPSQPSRGSFLSGLADGWGRSPQPAANVAAASGLPDSRIGSQIGSQVGQGQGNRLGAFQQGFQASQAMPARAGGGMGGFLGNAAMAAAGVAGGMFLFNGIERLMNGGSQEHQNEAAKLADNSSNAADQQNGQDAAQAPSDMNADNTVADASQDDGGWFGGDSFFGGDDSDSDIV